MLTLRRKAVMDLQALPAVAAPPVNHRPDGAAGMSKIRNAGSML